MRHRPMKRPAQALRNAGRPSISVGINSTESLAKPALTRNGVFATWAPRYAEHGVPVFPIADSGSRKRPAVRNWRGMGVRTSEQLAMRFGEAESLAFCAGRLSRLSVLDVDTNSEETLADAIAAHGPTPIVIRTGSGHFHCWYRHAGEPRRIRPNPAAPIDILGDGVVVAPPSLGRRQAYQFIAGGLDDLDTLPTMRTASANDDHPVTATAAAGERIQAGGRNRALIRHLMWNARSCDTADDLLDVAFSFVADRIDRTTGHDFTDSEIRDAVAWAWAKTADGKNFAGIGRKIVIDHADYDRIAALGSDAWALFSHLQRHHWQGDFSVPNGLATTITGGPWSLDRLRQARRRLVDNGIIRSIKSPSTHTGPERFEWA